MTQDDTPDSPLTFPCDFPIKVFGADGHDFEGLVVALVAKHIEEVDITVATRPSKKGRYQAVTVTIRATSREQLDAIYMDLTGHERIIMVL